jgi:phospholipid/cholesterol/gamma-HCH transport system substrate-binding protein
MVTRAPHRAAIAVAIMFILASVCLSLFVWSSLGGDLPFSPKGWRFHASFTNASALDKNADVRIAGVDVGKVVSVAPDGLRTNATIQLDPQYAPLASDAHAILRQKTLLGETFIELTPGTRGARKLPEGGTLPVSQIAPTQPLDRVLGVLDPRTRRDVQALFTNGATAFAGRADDLNAGLGDLGPLSRQMSAISGILDRQRRPVQSLVNDAGTVLRTIGAHRQSVASLVGAADQVLGATDRRNAQLTATIRELGPFLAQLRTTSARATTTAHIAAPVLHALRPVAPLVAPGLDALRTMSPQVTSLLRDLRTALPVAQRALPATAHLTRALIPFIDVVYPATREITPIIDMVSAYRRELIATMANAGDAAEATSEGINGRPVHYLRTLVPFTEEGMVGYAHRLPSNRHNAYFAPGGLAAWVKGGLLAADCRNTANPQIVPVVGTGAPPCKQQPGWTLDGQTRYYPHLERSP